MNDVVLEQERAEVEKYQRLWLAVRRDEHRVHALIENVVRFKSERTNDDELASLYAEIAQIETRFYALGSTMDMNARRTAEARYVISEIAESRTSTSVFDAHEKTRRAAEVRDANETIDALIAVKISRLALVERQATATSPAPVVAAKRSEKKPSIETVALDYMRAEFKQGQFQSAAKFHKHLIKTAGVTDSPFEMGTGVNARKLFCPAASSFYDVSTLGKIWAKIRAG